MSPASKGTPRPQSSAMPSPFPPIENYAFLSDCHTGALVAPDGAVAWLCVPRFDSPSVFGTLLDREAGYFRVGPFGINVPTSRVYEPGTNILVTTWNTPGGWLVVRDALTMGPTRGPDTVTPHTRPPADDDADHTLVRTIECIDGEVEVERGVQVVVLDGHAGLLLVTRFTDHVEGQGGAVRREDGTALGDLGPMLVAAVVEARGDVDVETHPPAHALHHPDEPMGVGGRVSRRWHEVDDLPDA